METGIQNWKYKSGFNFKELLIYLELRITDWMEKQNELAHSPSGCSDQGKPDKS